jgi:TonB family protein
MRQVAAGCLLALVFVACLLAQDKGPAAQSFGPTSLLQKALDVSDIQAPGSPSFRLAATVELTPPNSKPIQGTYELLWVNEGKWREAIDFPGYHRLRVGDAGSYWQVRNTDFEIPRVSDLEETLNFAVKLIQDLGDPSVTIADHKKEASGSCMEVQVASRSGVRTDRKLCFDVATNTLTSEDEPKSSRDITRREYGRYVAFAGKTFPRAMRAFAGRQAAVVIAITDLNEYRSIDLAKFVTPQKATLWAHCRAPVRPQILTSVPPVYPINEKMSYRDGHVLVYGVISEDGSLQHLRVLEATSQDFAQSALSALLKWRYEPAMCAGKAIKQETFEQITFSLR